MEFYSKQIVLYEKCRDGIKSHWEITSVSMGTVFLRRIYKMICKKHKILDFYLNAVLLGLIHDCSWLGWYYRKDSIVSPKASIDWLNLNWKNNRWQESGLEQMARNWSRQLAHWHWGNLESYAKDGWRLCCDSMEAGETWWQPVFCLYLLSSWLVAKV